MKVVVADKKYIHMPDGRKGAGSVVEVSDTLAAHYMARGAVEPYETKVVREVPADEPKPARKPRKK